MIEIKDPTEGVIAWQEERKAIKKALKPFAEMIKTSSGRIPIERLSLSDWHELVKTYNRLLEIEKNG